MLRTNYTRRFITRRPALRFAARRKYAAMSTYRRKRLYSLMRTGGNYAMPLGGPRLSGGPERKFIDGNGALTITGTQVGAASPGAAGAYSITVLNALTQGTDATNRLGRKILMKSIQLRLELTDQLAATGLQPAGILPGEYRIVVVFDTQTNGAAPAAADIFQSTPAAGLITPLNLNNRERFKVVWDKVRHVDQSGPATAHVKLYKKCNYPVVFNAGNAGTVGDIQTGGLFICIATTLSATAAPGLQVNLYTRVRFTDD